MSLSLLVIPAICYMAEAVLSALRGDYAGTITFSAYSVANIGLIWRFLYT